MGCVGPAGGPGGHLCTSVAPATRRQRFLGDPCRDRDFLAWPSASPGADRGGSERADVGGVGRRVDRPIDSIEESDTKGERETRHGDRVCGQVGCDDVQHVRRYRPRRVDGHEVGLGWPYRPCADRCYPCFPRLVADECLCRPTPVWHHRPQTSALPISRWLPPCEQPAERPPPHRGRKTPPEQNASNSGRQAPHGRQNLPQPSPLGPPHGNQPRLCSGILPRDASFRG